MRTAQLLLLILLSIFVFEVAHAAGTHVSTAANQQLAQAGTATSATPQSSPSPEAPPKGLHGGGTRMSAHAHRMQEKVAADISKAKAEGKDVGEAEQHKAEGDKALADGHFRIAVRHYRAAERTLRGKKAGAAPMPTAGAPK